ncbi:hypothetical protein V8F20_009746 [Naviculisporaceae sp. PSN 640]
MGRNRVLSFISQFSAPHKDSRSPTPTQSPPKLVTLHDPHLKSNSSNSSPNTQSPQSQPIAIRNEPSPVATTPSPVSTAATDEHANSSPPVPVTNSNSSSPSGTPRRNSRPLSMVQTYQPPLMDVNEETLPELQPIFNFLNSHTNKLYQEGYFLKLDDQDINSAEGKPNPDRTWTECFAQLVGTVLSLWDAAELDAAGEDGEVLPKFINLTDASIKMIESLPTRSNDEQPLQNILSISTAGRNRYLLHFNSHHSLIQWTSGIRLAMFEHSTLQEAYTGALVAGKGKGLNSINIIMERARLPIQEWVRVRFGAGVPWRRCWCVIDPPNEKEYQKAQKDLKKRSPYDRSHAPILKGEIRFYDSKKDAEKKKKHSKPIATITDAYAAYAIYPQAKPLIDGSTLLKLEGDITIHSDPPSSTEGFVFIMPEVPPAVSGFEMLLRFLFPTWDTFGLYGRPGRLVASVLDPRSLMFAMPKHKRYGYLEILDVSGLILTDGSSGWSEREWWRRLKELTGQRMAAVEEGGKSQSRSASRSSKRLSFGTQTNGPTRPRVNFADDSGSVRSGRSMDPTKPGLRTDSAPPDNRRGEHNQSSAGGHARHSRNISDTQITNAFASQGLDGPGPAYNSARPQDRARQQFNSDLASTPERMSSEDEHPGARGMPGRNLDEMQRMHTPEPVNPPPAFAHGAGSRPQQKPYHSPEMRRANSRLSSTTLSQLAKAGGLTPDAFPDEHMDRQYAQYGADGMNYPQGHQNARGPAVQPHASANHVGMNANHNASREVLMPPNNSNPLRASPGNPPPADTGRMPQQQAPGPGGPPRGPPPPAHQGPSNEHHSQQATGSGPGPRRTPPPQGSSLPPRFPGSPPVHRKPLPQRTTSLQRSEDRPVSPLTPHSSGGSGASRQQPFEANLLSYSPRPSTDDASSTTSPDYASTRRSTDTQESADRPRAGVLKTIGSGSGAPGSRSGPGNGTDYQVPEVNFGPTLNYGKVPPRQTETGHTGSSQRPFSPQGRRSPGPGASYSHFRQESDDTVRRSIPWQPGAATVGRSSGDNVVSPEQFVQQRAAAATPTPLYSHQRNPSAHTLTEFRTGTPTSPHKRPGTSHALPHSRHNSADLLQGGRPASQGSAAALSGGEVSTHLSAREQEHVARVTGTPLIALSGNRNPHPGQSQPGLVGTIQARERERAQMRHGIGGHAVAQAIDQRQREQNQQAQRAAQAAYAQQQAQFAAQQAHVGPQGVMSGGMPVMNAGRMSPGPGIVNAAMSAPRNSPGFQAGPGYGPQPAWPQMAPAQGPYKNNSPGGQGFAPAAGWVNQNMANMQQRSPGLHGPQGYGMMAQGGRPQSPGYHMVPQGQAVPVAGMPARPGTPGRMQFQGHAF